MVKKIGKKPKAVPKPRATPATPFPAASETLPSAYNFYPYMRSLHKIRGFQTEAACGSSSPPVRASHTR